MDSTLKDWGTLSVIRSFDSNHTKNPLGPTDELAE